jgi:hypothetical protein
VLEGDSMQPMPVDVQVVMCRCLVTDSSCRVKDVVAVGGKLKLVPTVGHACLGLSGCQQDSRAGVHCECVGDSVPSCA